MTEKRVAFVTGGSRGIGEAIVKRLAKDGLHVVAAARNLDKLNDVVGGIKSEGGSAEAVAVDVSDFRGLADAIDKVAEAHGRLDVLVNNAGWNVNAPMLTMKLDDYDAVANLTRGTWYLTKMVVRRFMFRAGTGRIINISSVVGHTGNPGQIPYTMVKAGLDAFTKSLAQELAGKDILVNSVAPGFIDTEMTDELPEDVKAAILARIPAGRMGTADEVADVVAFLATRGTYVNGTVIHVNGGMYGG
jgi:3-oxoacyl-[acyl-carrier protein] reductase